MKEAAPGFSGLRHWRLQTDANTVGWLAIDKADASANVLSREVMAEFAQALTLLEGAQLRGLVIYSGKEGSFIAGADITEFPQIGVAEDAVRVASEGQDLMQRLEALPCPVVAVLDGATLGGGLELALAADWRIALPGEKPCIGLPEVQLGLHPGFGGTVRTVRLLGVRKGMDLMLTGRSLTPREALACGLVDRISSAAGWREDALALLAKGRPARGLALVDRLLGLAPLRGFVARDLRKRAARKADIRHYPAPYAMIDLWEAHGGDATAAVYAAEAQSFGRLAVTATSRNLVRVFFLQDRLKKQAGRAAAAVRRVHVVGAGVMGGDIAAWCVLQGLEVTLQDREAKYIEPALERAGQLFERRLHDARSRQAARDRLVADIAGDGIVSADVVIEAIFENLEAKQALLARTEERARPDCILATNTSSIPLERIATALRDPARLIGIHFFNPVARLPLVEVVRTPDTSQQALAAGLAYVRQIGKLPLPCRSRPGFLVNRILAPYLAEAMALAREGHALAQIDQAAVDFGMPMGPIELADSVGLDIALSVARTLAPILGREVDPQLEQKVQAGQLGVKTGQGFYQYRERRPVKPPGRGMISGEIEERLVLALLNEAAHCLAEGIVDDADLVDAGVIFGTGFAPFRGGPLHYASARGIDEIVVRLGELSSRLGPRFSPSPGWQKLKSATG